MKEQKQHKLKTSDLAASLTAAGLATDKQAAMKMIGAVFGTLKSILFTELEKHGSAEVSILNFGSFAIKTSPGCTRKHPKTGERFQMPPWKRMNFRPCTEIKKSLKKRF